MRDFIDRQLFSLQVWCDQLDAETEAVLVLAVLIVGLASVTWIYFV